MSQSPAPGSSKPPTPTVSSSSSNFNVIFEKALKEYKKKTSQRLTAHPLATQLDKCDSPAAILAILQGQVDQFNQSQSRDERLQRWLSPTINVLLAFTETLGEGISLAFSPAKVIFVGAGVLLQAAKDVEASQDLLIDIFERIENFFRRLEVYTTVPPTPAMTDMMVKIIVEVLDILGTATKEMKQSRAKKFLKKIAGITKLEDGLKKLDKMTNDEARMANAEVMRLAYNIDKKVEGVDEKVQGVGGQVKDVDEKVQGVGGQVKDVDERVKGVDEKVQGVDEKVQGVGEKVLVVEGNVKMVEDKVQTVIDDGKQTAVIIQKVAYDVDDVKRSQLRTNLRQWQSPSDPSMNHNFASGRQYEGTAEWFCGGCKFGEWKVSGSLLWVHGKPGSGKSILCSAIINDIESLQKAGLASMAYFYFDFRDVRKQSHGDLLRSLLIQLSAHSDPFCDVLSRLYEEYGKGTRQPSDRALMHCLKEMLTLPNQCPVYLIVDALDECPHTSGIPTAREQVLDLVKELVGLHLSSLHICVTSRPEVNIRYALEGLASCSVSLHDESGQNEDITNYIKSVVHSPSDTHMKRWKEEDKDLVIQTLSEKADGMFRWVFCQLETLRQCLPQNVPLILSQLPATLDETYARVLKEIGKTNEFYALRLLQCLTVAKRPLFVEELAEILALDFGAEEGLPELKENWRSKDQQDAVLSMCSSLIAVVPDDSRHVVQFSHFSVKEFLTSDRLATSSLDISHLHILPEPAHTVVAKACLAILLRSEDANADIDERFPLIRYAAQYWVDHARFEKVWTRVEDGIRRLFDPAKPHLKSWLELSPIQESQFFAGYNLYKHCGSTLYYASLCGFRDLAARLISENPQHVTGPFGRNPTPLVAALQRGHLDIAELLYQAGADLGIRNDYNMTLLHAASSGKSVDVVRWLFDHGVRDNSQEDSGETLLHLTQPNRHRWPGITVNEADDAQNTPLHLASDEGHFEIVRELLRRGADVTAKDWKHETPLHRASRISIVRDHNYLDTSNMIIETVRLLVDHGADVTALDITHSTPLHLASLQGVLEAMQILIEHGADVKAQNETNLTPLHRASLLGDPQIVQLLIDHGADVTAKDWNHQTPLHFASSWDEETSRGIRLIPNAKADTIRLLIKHGADVAAQDKTHSTPLHLASSFRLAGAVQILIEHGADVNAQNESHSTPLHLASSSDDTNSWVFKSDQPIAKAETVRVLLKHGADVTMQDEAYSTPLHLASSRGSTETVRLLLQHGADVAAQDGNNRTPLHLASSWVDGYHRRHDDAKSNAKADTVRLLIKHSADVTTLDKTHSTALHLAAFFGSSEIVRLLLEHGTDVRILDENKKTPLHLALSLFDRSDDRSEDSSAISREKVEIVRLLIEQGADVTAKDKSLSTPLHLASSLGIPEIVRLLIERGADITAENESRRTPLHLASASPWVFHGQRTSSKESNLKADVVRQLIDHGADVAARDETRLTPLHLAAFSGSVEIVRLLIEHGADVTAQDGCNVTPLHSASSTYDSNIMQHIPMVSSNKARTMRLLIEHGADVTAQDETLSTPLHMASSSGIPDLVQLLIEHGADANGQDQSHRTPLHLASSREVWSRQCTIHPVDADSIADTMRLLIDHGANVATQDETHSTPLHLAAFWCNIEAVRLLLEHGADVTAQDGNHRTPLHLALSRDKGHQERFNWSHFEGQALTVLFLIRHGVDVTALDDTHSTPLHLASSMESTFFVDLLIRHGADINAQNRDQSTPLHLAASSRLALKGTIVRLLLRHGANVDAADSEGRTPLEIASSAGNSWIEKLLSDHLTRRG